MNNSGGAPAAAAAADPAAFTLGTLGDRGKLDDNARVYAAIEDFADLALARGQFNYAALWTEISALFASRFHPGCFQLTGAERRLLAVKEAAVDPAQPLIRRHGEGEERVLFVITEGLDVGGHTRVLCRLMESSTRPCGVVFTKNLNVPDIVQSTVSKLGAPLLGLLGTPVERARQLRRIASSFDLVVVDQLVCDTIPILAFGNDVESPPVVYFNQGDYVSWLGLSASNVVACFRGAGARLANQYRHIPLEHLAIVPMEPTPIEGESFYRDNRAAHRSKLGIDKDAVVLLTVATGYKTMPFLGLSLPGLLRPVLARHPETCFVAIGMDPMYQGPVWQALLEDFPGRVLLLPSMPVPESAYWIADVYLDTVPCGSALSALDASLRELPVVTITLNSALGILDETDGGWGVIGIEAPGFGDHHFFASSVDEYLTVLARLIGDPDYRREVGARGCADMLEFHGPGPVAASLENAYALAGKVGKVPLVPRDELRHGTMEILLAEMFDRYRWGFPLHQMIGILANRQQ